MRFSASGQVVINSLVRGARRGVRFFGKSASVKEETTAPPRPGKEDVARNWRERTQSRGSARSFGSTSNRRHFGANEPNRAGRFGRSARRLTSRFRRERTQSAAEAARRRGDDDRSGCRMRKPDWFARTKPIRKPISSRSKTTTNAANGSRRGGANEPNRGGRRGPLSRPGAGPFAVGSGRIPARTNPIAAGSRIARLGGGRP